MMGIRPNGDGAAPPVAPDNPETRYSDWLTDLEDSGEIVGGVWQETDAKATSANSGTSDLAGRLAALEAVSSTSGTGWAAYKQAGFVTIILTGLESGFSVPAGYRPPVSVHSPIVRGAASHDARFIIGPGGSLTLYGTFTTPVTGIVTYPAA